MVAMVRVESPPLLKQGGDFEFDLLLFIYLYNTSSVAL